MFADTDIAKNILEKRYYRGDESTPDELLSRVAGFVASPEENFQRRYSEFYDVMHKGQFLPNSPALVNAGMGGGLFACFVIGMDDDLGSIAKAKSTAMAITKAGGGWGIGLSNLRAAGSPVSGSTHGIAGGPIGFWKTFSYDMHTMTQGGFRDAACMATLDVTHPDILGFIEAKSPTNSVIEMLNLRRISNEPVTLASKLLEDYAIEAAAETYLSNFNISVLISDEFMKEADAYHGGGAHFLLNAIAAGAWSNGEPGVLFIDTIRDRTRYDPSTIQATNPCGEQPLPPNGSCCLGSVNLSEFVSLDSTWDCNEFERAVRIGVRFLDNMITLNEFPTPETATWSYENRSIGLGVMGYADALIKLGIRYGSEDAIAFAEDIANDLYQIAESESKALLAEKGPGTIGDFDGRRNNAILSVAPTGTISLLAGCSPGIEPIYAEKATREDRTGTYAMNHALAHMPEFVTLHDIGWEAIIDTVAAFSERVDTSISYTVNLPNDASVGDVKSVLKYAWTKRCNGCTIYRDGSRQAQVLTDTTVTKNQVEESVGRPTVLAGDTFKYVGNIEGESTNLYVTVNSNDGRPWEVFVNAPHIKSMTELQLVTAVTRLSSMALRFGAPVKKIVDQLRKIEGQSVTSVPALIARALSEYNKEPAGDCPECSKSMSYQGGCATCGECGYSKCG